jgi:hypothetical protein
MKLAICFWGLSRSLKYTISSIKENIFKELNSNNIEYKIFFHTYNLEKLYNNRRANELNIKYDNDDYKILNADYIEIDDQEEILEKINVNLYRTNRDPWNTNYQTVNNFILAMYSKKKSFDLIKNTGINFTHYLFIRPDVKYLNKFKISWLKEIRENEVYIPEFHHTCYNFNDRMLLTSNEELANLYGNVFDYMLEYSKKHQLHSETYIRYYLVNRYKGIIITFIKFYFNRVRANGKELIDC